MLSRYKPRLIARRLSHGAGQQGLFDRVGQGKSAAVRKKSVQPQAVPIVPLQLPAQSSPAGPPPAVPPPGGVATEAVSEQQQQIARLRAALLERERALGAHAGQDAGQDGRQAGAGLSLGDLDRHLPGGAGLPVGVLNEVTAGYAHRPAAFGFTFAMMALGQKRRPGPVILVMSRRALRDFGHPYGHGLAQFGLDVGELILVEADKDIDALWGIEEALRAQGCVALVAGAVTGSIDLTAARRLNLAAASTGTPLVVLRTGGADAGPAATRWRIETAPAQRDPYGGFGRWRWRAHLERCRNGRPGDWLIEWCHVAHRFHLVESLADRAPVAHPGRLRRAG